MLSCVFLKLKVLSSDTCFILLFNINFSYITTRCRCYNSALGWWLVFTTEVRNL